MENLAKAVIAVMKTVKGIDKTMTIGTGNSSYKGVPDQEVKKIIGDAMAANGLCIIPTSVDTKTQIDRWTEETNYGPKQKQSVFTEVTTKYILLHSSGEYIELAGYGHGVDTQDKGAGKATTYALKYALLYTFLVPTGKIDDSDNHHSESIDMPKQQVVSKEDLQKLRDMVFTSTLDEATRIATLEKIENCTNYKQYQFYQHKLEDVQQGFDDVANPNQKDINNKVKKITGPVPTNA